MTAPSSSASSSSPAAPPASAWLRAAAVVLTGAAVVVALAWGYREDDGATPRSAVVSAPTSAAGSTQHEPTVATPHSAAGSMPRPAAVTTPRSAAASSPRAIGPGESARADTPDVAAKPHASAAGTAAPSAIGSHPPTHAAAGDPALAGADVRGVIRPRDEVMFASKMAGRIAQMPWREGERFKKGALLVGFDCDRLHAQIRAAHAAHRAATQLAAQNRELDRYQAIGRHEVAISQAKADQAGAEAAALEVQQRDCVIHAPFDGLVVETSARLHQNAALGQDLMKVLATGDLEVHLVVPSAWLAWLEPGKAFAFRVDETARRYAAKVTRIGASVDPVSQTVKIVGVFTGERTGVLPGMSGSADFPQADPALAHATPR